MGGDATDLQLRAAFKNSDVRNIWIFQVTDRRNNSTHIICRLKLSRTVSCGSIIVKSYVYGVSPKIIQVSYDKTDKPNILQQSDFTSASLTQCLKRLHLSGVGTGNKIWWDIPKATQHQSLNVPSFLCLTRCRGNVVQAGFNRGYAIRAMSVTLHLNRL